MFFSIDTLIQSCYKLYTIKYYILKILHTINMLGGIHMDRTNQDQAYIAQLVERARAAQKIVEGYSQRRVDELAAALVYTLSRPDLAPGYR